MALDNPPVHVRLIERTHRRWVVWQVVECSGVCAAIGAGFGLFMVLVLMWRGEAAVIPALVAMAAGGVAGLVWGVTHRPSLLQTAMLIDKQLGLHDLLSTSITAQTPADEGFARIIVDQANAAAARISPNELILQRLGGRQWGGIGIAGALVLTLAMMSGQLPLTQAQSDADQPKGRVTAAVPEMTKRTQTGHQAGADEKQASVNESNRSDEGTEPSDASNRASGSSRRGAGSQADGGGSAAGRTAGSQVGELPRVSGTGSNSDTGSLTAGGGTDGSLAGHGAMDGPGQSGSVGPRIPVWKAETWPSDSAAADQKLEAGQIPDSYRDLVREYFRTGEQ